MSFFRCWQSHPRKAPVDATSLQPLPQAPLHGDTTHNGRGARPKEAHQGSGHKVTQHVTRPANIDLDMRDNISGAVDDLAMAGFAGLECPYIMTFLEHGQASSGGSAAGHGGAGSVVFQNAQSSRCGTSSGLFTGDAAYMHAVLQCIDSNATVRHVPIAPLFT